MPISAEKIPNRLSISLVCLFVSLFSMKSTAQDKHFTQFFASPLTLNPALTGAFDGMYRVSGIYRDQWRNVLDQPYQTFSTAIDARFELTQKSRYRDAISGGIMFFSDKVGVIDFNTNQMALSGAFHKALSKNRGQYLSLGIQGALNQRNVNYESLTFNDQFKNELGYVVASRENLPPNNFSFSDLAVGLNYSYNPADRTAIFIGASMHHILEPRISFYEPVDDQQQPILEEGPGVNLYRKYALQLSGEFPLQKNGTISMLPRLLVSIQGPHMRLNAGTNFRFALSDTDDVAFQLGGWFRPVKNEQDAFFIDAFVGMAGFEFENFRFGLSYDINLRDLQVYNQGQGSFEILLTYIGNFENESILCPTF